MDEKEVVKKLFADIYNLHTRYLYVWMDDFLWERLIDEQRELSIKYEQYGNGIHDLCCRMILSLVEYKSSQQKEIKAAGVNMREGDIVKRLIEPQNENIQ